MSMAFSMASLSQNISQNTPDLGQPEWLNEGCGSGRIEAREVIHLCTCIMCMCIYIYIYTHYIRISMYTYIQYSHTYFYIYIYIHTPIHASRPYLNLPIWLSVCKAVWYVCMDIHNAWQQSTKTSSISPTAIVLPGTTAPPAPPATRRTQLDLTWRSGGNIYEITNWYNLFNRYIFTQHFLTMNVYINTIWYTYDTACTDPSYNFI